METLELTEKGVTSSCPYCGSTRIIKKGFTQRKNGRIQVLGCKDCRRRFLQNKKTRRKYDFPDNLAEKYLTIFKSLEALDTAGSITTRHRKVVEQVKRYPGWRDLLHVSEFRARWGFILGIDTTSLKINGKEFCYLHVVDIPGKDHLAYEIMEKEDAASIKEVLRTLRNAGYYPKLVVTDLAPEILSAVKEVFPEAEIQGCIFHLQQWLNKQLPTMKKRVDKQTFQVWRTVKRRIMEVAKAKNMEIRQHLLAELKNMKLDETSSSVVKMFLENLQYYHTLQDLIWLGCKREFMYNNCCERSIGEFKYLIREKCGFKNFENAQKYKDAFWFLKRKGIAENRPIKVTKKEIAAKLPLFRKITDLKELSEDTGIKFEALKEEAEKAGFKVIGNLAFSPDWLQKAREKLEKEKPKTLEDGMKLLRDIPGDVPWDIFKLLGFDIKIKTCFFNPSEILLVPLNKNQELVS